MLVQHYLEQSARHTPDKIALVCDGRRLSYGEIEQMANRLANALQACSIRPGERVLLFLPNCVELVVGIFATLKVGAVFVVVNSTTKLDKLAYLANNCRAAALLAQEQQAALAAQLVSRVQSLRFLCLCGTSGTGNFAGVQKFAFVHTFDEIQRQYPDSVPAVRRSEADLACLIYTSGSTGEPKGVMSSHGNMTFAVHSITTYLENTADDIVLNALPLSFDYGLYQLLMTFSFGGTLVLERSFTYPVQVLQRMAAERVTGFPGVPTIFAILLRMELRRYDLAALRYITNTAAALPPSHIQQIRALFPGARLYSMYGLTETKRTLYLPPEQLDHRPDSVGVAIPGTEVWLEDEAGQQLGSGQVGELVISGPHVMQGYWENPEATVRRFRTLADGRRICYSGDLFRMDEEGYFYFVGRKDDIIKSRGEKVAPKEIENILYALPGVVEAAVIGILDPVLGQAIKAVVVCANGELDEQTVLRHCRANLEDFMVPQIVEFRNTLPKTGSGKIRKTDLVMG